MELTFDIKLDVLFDEETEITHSVLAQAFKELGYGPSFYEEVVHALNEQLVETYCGEKHARGNGDKRFQRGPTKDRTIVTTLGELEFTFQWVADHDSAPEENTYFRPLDDLLDFDGEQIYQDDLSMVAAELATKMSYRDASTEGERFTEMPAKSTINQRVFQFGEQIQAFVEEKIEDTATETIYPDGTKCHSQDPDRTQHDVKVTLGETDGGRALLDVTVWTGAGLTRLPRWRHSTRSTRKPCLSVMASDP